MAMIASEALGIPLARVAIAPSVDTDFTADTGNTAGSRQTLSGGWGAYEAAIDARNQVPAVAASRLKVKPEDLDIDIKANGTVFVKADPAKKLTMNEVVGAAQNPIIGRGAHIHERTWARIGMGAHAAEVEVDSLTGSVKILKYVAAHHVGKAIKH